MSKELQVVEQINTVEMAAFALEEIAATSELEPGIGQLSTELAIKLKNIICEARTYFYG